MLMSSRHHPCRPHRLNVGSFSHPSIKWGTMEISGSTTRWARVATSRFSFYMSPCRRRLTLSDVDTGTKRLNTSYAFSNPSFLRLGPVPHFLPTASPLGGHGRKIRWVMWITTQVRVGGRWKRRTGRVCVTSRHVGRKKNAMTMCEARSIPAPRAPPPAAWSVEIRSPLIGPNCSFALAPPLPYCVALN